MSIRQQFRVLVSWMACVVLLGFGSSAQAAPLNLAKSPLYLGTQIDPNVFFMLDDSGSMDWEILTKEYNYYSNYWSDAGVALVDNGRYKAYRSSGNCTGRKDYAYIFENNDNAYDECNYPVAQDLDGTGNYVTELFERDWRIRSAGLNIMYYNPAVTYNPWVGFPQAVFAAARSNPQPGSAGYSETMNLDGFIYEVAIDDHGFTGSTANGKSDVTDTPNGQVDLYDSHTTHTVGASVVTGLTLTTANAAIIGALPNCEASDSADTPPYAGCYGTTSLVTAISGVLTDSWGRNAAEIRQNVANWYQYHRKRSFVTKAAVASVVTSNPSFRYGLSLINDYDDLFYEIPAADVTNYNSHNASMLNELFGHAWESNGTPLRRGLEVVGRYFDASYNSGSTIPTTNPVISSCQQNYTVLFTDGYWNGSSPLSLAIADEDNDGHYDTVADVARYYYQRDLNTAMANQVPTSTLDGNNKQHLVTFTVAFGVTGNLVDTDNDGLPNPVLGVSDNWGDPFDSDQEKIDDLWHAAFNSSGEYVSAQDPAGVADAISDALSEVADRVGSSASVATNTGSLNAGSHLFQARFDSSDWKGQLLAYHINLDGSIDALPAWDAGSRINVQNYNTGRTIITFNPDADVIAGGTVEGKGVPFRFPADYTSPNALSDLSSSQIEYLLENAPFSTTTSNLASIAQNQIYGKDVLDYLRGDTSNEARGQNFRNRNSVLGDIVNSDPKFVGKANFRYPNDLESKPYGTFKSSHENRNGVVYVGANDGMLHGFDESTGVELMAYVPSPVFENLAELTEPGYNHRYFVDGGPNIVDAYLAGANDGSGTPGAWRTVLSAGLGGGGQGIYTLDVTDPTAFSEANASSIALWEFNDSDDADLGFTYSRPQIAKMSNGKWVAVFGNGYNNTAADDNVSTSGHAVLFIVDIETGELIRKIDTGAGSVGTPNGLATPLLVDEDGDSDVDYIYAGDLLGNMWKFNVNGALPSSWDVAFKTFGAPQPLFTTSANQPITSQPQAAFHPDNLGGFMLYFGTGKYIETNDNNSYAQATQAFYGIWDKNTGTRIAFDSSDLLRQTIDNQYFATFDTDGDSVDDVEYTLRDVSNKQINYSSHMGWRMDLKPLKIEGVANALNFGERQVSNAIIRNGRVLFTTLAPSQMACDFGGTSFLMQLDFRDGSVLPEPAFDLNNDGIYNAQDTTASGRASHVGIMPTVSLLSDSAQDIAFGSGASGDVDVIQLNVGSDYYGRQSWRQMEQ